MGAVFQAVDGKKTNIAAGIAAASALLLGIGQIWQIDADWYYRSVETLTYIAGFLGGGGLLHKVVKARK